jgi:hypothetical protein
MRCKECDYPLWNLATRTCPECGTVFLPSQYSFIPNSVQYRCPHCPQVYYGNDAHGHLIPRSFACASCGNPVEMDQMVLLPAPGVAEAQTTVDTMPWLERQRIGPIRAWFSMIGYGLARPGVLGRSIPMESSVGAAWWYAILTSLIISIVCGAPMLLFVAAMTLATRAGSSAYSMVMFTVAHAVICAVLLVVWGLAAHGLLLISGPRPAGGLGATYRALCYSTGANVLTAVPCLGVYFGWIWWVISAVITLKNHQRVGGMRATIAVATFPLLFVLSIIGAYVYLIVWTIGMAGAAAAAGPGAPGAATSGPFGTVYSYRAGGRDDGSDKIVRVTRALRSFPAIHEGRMPTHGLELVDNATLTVPELIAPGSRSSIDTSIVGDASLSEFRFMPQSEARLVVQKATAALPQGVIAHRIADVVFTYHGVDLADTGSGLWVAILWPDPVFNPGPPTTNVFVGVTNGGRLSVPPETFADALQQQNALRTAAGLAPLPDPATVTTRAPAAAPPK